jgi:hypothetical protein
MTAHASDGKADQTLSQQICHWVDTNDWYRTDGVSNRMKLDMKFGARIRAAACYLDAQGRDRHRRRLLDCWDNVLGKCLQVDQIWRAECRTQEERDELELLVFKAEAAALELVRVVRFTLEGRSRLREPKEENREDEWITIKEAALLIGKSEGTISRLANEGVIKNNGQSRRERKVSRVSVLLYQSKRDAQNKRNDYDDYQRDIRNIPDQH